MLSDMVNLSKIVISIDKRSVYLYIRNVCFFNPLFLFIVTDVYIEINGIIAKFIYLLHFFQHLYKLCVHYYYVCFTQLQQEVSMKQNTIEYLKQSQGRYSKYLFEQEKAPATIRLYTKYVKDLAHFLEYELKVGMFDKSHIVLFRQNMEERYVPGTINTAISALNSFFKYNHWDYLKLRKLKLQHVSSVENGLSIAEYNRLLVFAKQRNEKMYYIIRTIAGSGIRVGELKYITVEAINEGTARVVNKGKIRNVLLKSSLCTLLMRYCKKHGITHGTIFRGSSSNKSISREYICRKLKDIGGPAGIPCSKLFTHNLRHLFAQQFIDKHNDITALADILGHTSIETTRIYTRTSNAEKRAKIEDVDL